MTTRIPQISGFSRGGVKLAREGFGIVLSQGDREVVLPVFEARELALALLLLAEEADTRLEMHRLGWEPAKIDEVMRGRAEESRK